MKRKMLPLRAALCTTLLAAAITSTAANAANMPPAPMQLLLLALADNAMALTHRLLNESSAAKSIMASDNERAKALHAEAVKFYEEAVKANEAGDEVARDAALKKAKMNLFKAAQLAQAAPGLGDRSHSMFKRRLQSASALLDAHQRIRKETEAGSEVKALEKKAIADIDTARAAFKKDDVDAANKLINKALGELKGSLISMRNGTTLVRSLHFETPKEEYEYELDRNQSHTLLTSILLQKKPLSENARQRFDKDMEQAKTLRKLAEEQADKGDYEAAIKTLEESTKHIVRAIRAAGVYIPG